MYFYERYEIEKVVIIVSDHDVVLCKHIWPGEQVC